MNLIKKNKRYIIMKKVFIIGSVTKVSKRGQKIFDTYKNIVQANLKNAQIILPEDIKNYRIKYRLYNPDASISDTTAAMVDYDLQQIVSSDLLIADVSRASTGLGIEIVTAKSNNKEIIYFANAKSVVSMMLLGYIHPSKINWYKNQKELATILKTYLK